MESLVNLYLGYNQLSGPLPSLKGLSNLAKMTLQYHNFTPNTERSCFSTDWIPSQLIKYSGRYRNINVDGMSFCSHDSDSGSDYLLGG